MTTALLMIRQVLLPTLVKLGPPRFRRFLVNLLPFKIIRRLRNTIDIMHNTSVEILQAKRRALQEGDEAVEKQIGRGRDIMSILSKQLSSCRFPSSLNFSSISSVKANMEASEGDKLTEEEVLGQVLISAFGDVWMSLTPYRPPLIDGVCTCLCGDRE
jgi:hypothetical protein